MDEKTSIKEAYQNRYPEDNIGFQLNDVTFEDVFRTLDNYESVYKLIGVYDSIIRGRIFSMLAKIMCVEYSYIYEQWMLCEEG